MRSTIDKGADESFVSLREPKRTIPRVASLAANPYVSQGGVSGDARSNSRPGSVKLHSKLKPQSLEATFSK